LLRLVMPEWPAALVTAFVISLPQALGSDVPLALAWPIDAAGVAIPTLVLLRFGLLAAITNLFVVNQIALNLCQMRALGEWTSAPAAVLLPFVGGLAVFGFRAATSGRRRG
jgi:hypothetical protein